MFRAIRREISYPHRALEWLALSAQVLCAVFLLSVLWLVWTATP